MESLEQKTYKTYDYISRYQPFPYYYNKNDKKYIYGLTSQLRKDVSFVTVEITQRDTLDSLANYHYGRPDYYWVIADFNDIVDPFIPLFGNYKSLNIPNLGNINFK